MYILHMYSQSVYTYGGSARAALAGVLAGPQTSPLTVQNAAVDIHAIYVLEDDPVPTVSYHIVVGGGHQGSVDLEGDGCVFAGSGECGGLHEELSGRDVDCGSFGGAAGRGPRADECLAGVRHAVGLGSEGDHVVGDGGGRCIEQ